MENGSEEFGGTSGRKLKDLVEFGNETRNLEGILVRLRVKKVKMEVEDGVVMEDL